MVWENLPTIYEHTRPVRNINGFVDLRDDLPLIYHINFALWNNAGRNDQIQRTNVIFFFEDESSEIYREICLRR